MSLIEGDQGGSHLYRIISGLLIEVDKCLGSLIEGDQGGGEGVTYTG